MIIFNSNHHRLRLRHPPTPPLFFMHQIRETFCSTFEIIMDFFFLHLLLFIIILCFRFSGVSLLCTLIYPEFFISFHASVIYSFIELKSMILRLIVGISIELKWIFNGRQEDLALIIVSPILLLLIQYNYQFTSRLQLEIISLLTPQCINSVKYA